MDTDINLVPRVPQCTTCHLIRIRDITREKIRKSTKVAPNDNSFDHGLDPSFHYKPFELEDERCPTLSYKATLDFCHDESLGSTNRATPICHLCNHWVNCIFSRDWGEIFAKEQGNDHSISRISFGVLTEIETRPECVVCRFLSQVISESSFVMDNTRTLCLGLSKKSYIRSSGFQATGTILYEDEEEFMHYTVLEKKRYPQFAVFKRTDRTLDFADAKINWKRLRQWNADLPAAAVRTFPSSSVSMAKTYLISEALPKGFCLINVSKACLIETDGVQVPSYAALSYVWGKADEEIITTTKNIESLKLPGRFREKDVPLLFRDAFEVCSQLGIEYFWIDRICVVQDDDQRKSAQLEAMGRIYSKARITIVSPELHFIDQGLPGVSQPRTPPLKILLGDMILVPTTHESKSDSTWRTRGWTYQEGLLSLKCNDL